MVRRDEETDNFVRSSYSPWYFLNELDCPGGWAPLPDAEKIWFICEWHDPDHYLYAYADGHVEWANDFIPGQVEGRTLQYWQRLREVCPPRSSYGNLDHQFKGRRMTE